MDYTDLTDCAETHGGLKQAGSLFAETGGTPVLLSVRVVERRFGSDWPSLRASELRRERVESFRCDG